MKIKNSSNQSGETMMERSSRENTAFQEDDSAAEEFNVESDRDNLELALLNSENIDEQTLERRASQLQQMDIRQFTRILRSAANLYMQQETRLVNIEETLSKSERCIEDNKEEIGQLTEQEINNAKEIQWLEEINRAYKKEQEQIREQQEREAKAHCAKQEEYEAEDKKIKQKLEEIRRELQEKEKQYNATKKELDEEIRRKIKRLEELKEQQQKFADERKEGNASLNQKIRENKKHLDKLQREADRVDAKYSQSQSDLNDLLQQQEKIQSDLEEKSKEEKQSHEAANREYERKLKQAKSRCRFITGGSIIGSYLGGPLGGVTGAGIGLGIAEIKKRF
ncbi:hypothetical protein EC973_001493 [Apophysomyces ossiformis]|uniref:Uncharacterized protein n=1 Tax=Apophysomyces ossiformis TaxID=679940 RepID=A0A8H7BP69_9FUNG|nr:hypothetical protein EC973_001493 [Apophysomyces ossiformis]